MSSALALAPARTNQVTATLSRASFWRVSNRDTDEFRGISLTKRYSPTERLGVTYVDSTITKHGWIFREQPILDVGVDAHVEVVEDGDPTGKMVSLQIKSGMSYLEDKGEYFVYRGDRVHLEYWLNYILPVFIIVYLPDTEKAYWEEVTKDKIKETGKGWKIYISRRNELNQLFFNAVENKAGIQNKLTSKIACLCNEGFHVEARQLMHENWNSLDDAARLIECAFLMQEKNWQEIINITNSIHYKTVDIKRLQYYYVFRAVSFANLKRLEELKEFLNLSIDELNDAMAESQGGNRLQNPFSKYIVKGGVKGVDLLMYGAVRFVLVHLAYQHFPSEINFEKYIHYSLMPHGFGISRTLNFVANTESIVAIAKSVIYTVQAKKELSLDLYRSILSWFDMVYRSLSGTPMLVGDDTCGVYAHTNPESSEDDLRMIKTFIEQFPETVKIHI